MIDSAEIGGKYRTDGQLQFGFTAIPFAKPDLYLGADFSEIIQIRHTLPGSVIARIRIEGSCQTHVEFRILVIKEDPLRNAAPSHLKKFSTIDNRGQDQTMQRIMVSSRIIRRVDAARSHAQFQEGLGGRCSGLRILRLCFRTIQEDNNGNGY